MYTLTFFVPTSDAEKVKDAVFRAGAGAYRNYDRCCFQVEGTGEFRPLENARPHIGEAGKVERVKETRIEVLVRDETIKDVVRALLEAHPYEEPAYYVYRTLTAKETGVDS
jgi:hypothetical protein